LQCSPSGLEPMSRTSEALTAQYLNVRQRKLGTFIIQTVHILQHDSAVIGSLSEGDILHGNPTCFQITLPGSIVPLHFRNNRGGSILGRALVWRLFAEQQ
jgi:hypothetical protein